jgi:hypothetical protein
MASREGTKKGVYFIVYMSVLIFDVFEAFQFSPKTTGWMTLCYPLHGALLALLGVSAVADPTDLRMPRNPALSTFPGKRRLIRRPIEHQTTPLPTTAQSAFGREEAGISFSTFCCLLVKKRSIAARSTLPRHSSAPRR